MANEAGCRRKKQVAFPTESETVIGMSNSSHALFQSRGWLVFGGVLSIFVGFAAMGSPLLFSLVLTQFLGIFLIVSGVVTLIPALFGKHVAHRVLEAVSSLIRLAAGIVVLTCLPSSVAVITLVLAIFLMVEGLVFIVGAIQLRSHQGWVWTLINGIAAMVLGGMVLGKWPSDALWVLGLLFGINSLFTGMSLLMLGLAAKPAQAA